MKGKTVDEVYDAIRKKEIVLITKYSTERLSAIIKYEAIIKQQIRSPQQILDDRINGTKTIGRQTEDEQFEDQMWGDII